MSLLLAVSIGVVVSAAVYLFLARDLPRVLIGFVLLGMAANLAILAAGRIGPWMPPLVPSGAQALPAGAGNPLPQALILTAIVIGFGLMAFALMLIVKAQALLGSVRSEDMHEAETSATADAPLLEAEPYAPGRTVQPAASDVEAEKTRHAS
ncbi:MAG: NADH-quinone oxidoreductase subunit K [Hyphomicrobiaceae bacterium]|nr:NADH-quinone oxidoreductase subunit K [Hyphomicrobiaceae bacterium]